ncbi:hypothetical protein HMPREF0766_13749 [Sphingobacterium spiritivorum ATCC 33861]|uniref:Uncharacterized protein n=1 Tax=Sphingobacterium spiritivorum ATCC 33861 TaxID=525373 RepID=D7VRZ5_SPHSI|nr:hypothetical protein HMPREF0766_13749 [Sphingobacterium spiritivorum ATCC 33861]
MIILTWYKCQKNKINAQYVGKYAQSLDFTCKYINLLKRWNKIYVNILL